MSGTSTPLHHSFIAGGLAGLTVDVALFPLDTVKTRLQSAEGFLRSGGLRGLYAGVGTAAAGSVPTGTAVSRAGSTTTARPQSCPPVLLPALRRAQSARSLAWTPEGLCPRNLAGIGKRPVSSFRVACIVRVPIEVVKQRRQTRREISARHILTRTLAEEGVIGLYRGLFSTIAREVPFSILQLPLWEAMKAGWWARRGRPVEPWQAGLCGGVAGGLSAAITNPLDVAKTRIMLADRHTEMAHGGILTALRCIRRQDGIRGLFAGVVPRVLWISIGGTVFFGSYSMVMHLIS
ncbi:S-adenosylmethionine mitochondrial carrier protein-like isoform X1 [Pollicipes pollicipes]|uniref:S-adenosylmethionine mitochondrial carrier protein-like isoform X1 n=1 Tax=Pollicipes pollicipes TaxID=41117 RepID=UPI001884FC50|nr:S-adenosylmethionine mitochondrial carrier protein-like isoform X1 [Pollicipes pollicipes]